MISTRPPKYHPTCPSRTSSNNGSKGKRKSVKWVSFADFNPTWSKTIEPKNNIWEMKSISASKESSNKKLVTKNKPSFVYQILKRRSSTWSKWSKTPQREISWMRTSRRCRWWGNFSKRKTKCSIKSSMRKEKSNNQAKEARRRTVRRQENSRKYLKSDQNISYIYLCILQLIFFRPCWITFFSNATAQQTSQKYFSAWFFPSHWW